MIRSILLFTAAVASIGALFSGCDRGKTATSASEKDAEPKVAAKKPAAESVFSPLASTLKPEDVIMRINGDDVTKADYDKWLNLKGRLFKFAKRRPLAAGDEESDVYLHNSATKAFGEITRRVLMRQAAAKAGVEPTEAQIKAVESDFLEQFGRGREKMSSIYSKFGPVYGPALKQSIVDDARERALLEKWSTNSLTVVTQEEIDLNKTRAVEILANLEEMNRKSREKAIAARDEVLKEGKMFADVAKERSDFEPGQGRQWDIFELSEFEAGDPLGQWLATADVGDISEPLEMDDGLAVVGVLSKTPTESAEHPGKQVDLYELVRMLFKIYDPPSVPETDDEWREEILEVRRTTAMQALGKELGDAAKIEFPNGQQLLNVQKKKKKGAVKGKNAGGKSAKGGKKKSADDKQEGNGK